MAEYEGKSDTEICFTCRHFYPTKEHNGWCKRRPRLAQKHDDRTHATNWCWYYEVDMTKRTELEKAMETFTQIPDTSLNDGRGILNQAERDMIDQGTGDSRYDHVKIPPKKAEETEVVTELRQLQKEIADLANQCSTQLTAAAQADNTLLMMETKGMMRVAIMLANNIGVRITALTK